MKIFIPFASGILRCACRECGSLCCRSNLLLLNDKERKKVIRQYPAMRFFLRKDPQKGTYRLPHSCWFLEGNGRCRLQSKYGYSKKPLICRLHPFYIAECKGAYIVIPQLCQMLYVSRNIKDSSRRRLQNNAREAIRNGYVEQIPEAGWTKKRIRLEEQIAQDLPRFLSNPSYIDFSIHQIMLTQGARNVEDIKSEVKDKFSFWQSFLGMDKFPIAHKELTYELTAITSLLRLMSPTLRRMEVERLPFALLALYLCMMLHPQQRKSKTAVVTYLQILEDLAVGMAYLSEDDLHLKSRRLQEKIRYIHLLKKIYYRQPQKQPSPGVVKSRCRRG